jgi:integrase
MVRKSKTDAGIRKIRILPVLRDELLAVRARLADAPAAALVFPTSTVEKLPEGPTPHSLRRTFASLRFAIGEPPPWVMRQMGHTTPNRTLAMYAREMDRRDGEPERLRALVEGAEWAPSGTSTPNEWTGVEITAAA